MALNNRLGLGRKNTAITACLSNFSLRRGRCCAVVRGAHRKKRGGSLASLLQPFQPLLVSMVGRGDLKTVRQVEPPSAGYSLRGEALIQGMYINELLVRVLPRFYALPHLFVAYGRAAEQLGMCASESTLRRFELALLSELGYSVNLRTVNMDRSFGRRPTIGTSPSAVCVPPVWTRRAPIRRFCLASNSFVFSNGGMKSVILTPVIWGRSSA